MCLARPARDESLGVADEVAEAQPLRVEGPCLLRLDEGEAGPGQKSRARNAEVRVRGSDLRVVRDLGGPTHVGGGRQERVLDERAQESARAPRHGVGLESTQRVLDRPPLAGAAHLDRSVCQRESPALALHHGEEVQEARSHGDLLVIARGQEGVSSLEGEAGGGRSLAQLAREDRDHQALQVRVRGIEHDDPGQQPRDEAREGLGQGGARAVTPGDGRERLVAAQRGWQGLAELVDHRLDRVVEGDGPRRLTDRLVAWGVPQRPDRPRSVDQARRPDLREVVVVRGHPEHGDDRHPALLLEDARHPHCPQGLPQDEERAAEEARLLARHDSDGPRDSQGSRALRRFLCPAGLLLPGERLGHGSHRPIEPERPLRSLSHSGQVEAARAQEGPNRLVARQIVEEERAEGLVERTVGDHVEVPVGHSRTEDSIAATYSDAVTCGGTGFDTSGNRVLESLHGGEVSAAIGPRPGR